MHHRHDLDHLEGDALASHAYRLLVLAMRLEVRTRRKVELLFVWEDGKGGDVRSKVLRVDDVDLDQQARRLVGGGSYR